MSRGAWAVIRQSKLFYANSYRRMIHLLIISACISILLLIGIFDVYFSRNEHDFYSTDGVTPPILLMPMDKPNGSSSPLLPDDQIIDDETRVLPK